MDEEELELLMEELRNLPEDERQKRVQELGLAPQLSLQDSLTTIPLPEIEPTVGPVNQPQLDNFIRDAISVSRLQGQPMSAYSDEQLRFMIEGGSPEAEQELAKRQEVDEMGVGRLASPHFLNRMVRQGASGFHQAFGSDPVGLAGLVAKGGEFVTGADLNADELLQTSQELRERIQSEFGISEPRGPGESLVEVGAGMAVPIGKKPPTGVVGNLAELVTPLTVGGGAGRMAANVGVGFGLEQGVRELADDDGTEYQTIFDKLRGAESEDNAYPEAVQALVTGLGVFAGASILTPAAVKAMRGTKINTNTRPRTRSISDMQMDGPKDLETIERAGDLYKTYAVDEKTVLMDIADRAGMPDIDEVRSRVDQDTQISGLMKANEAVRTGKLRTVNGNFDSTIAPQQVYRNARSLPQAKQQDADRYLKLHDLIDDLNIRINNGVQVAQSQQMLQQAQKQIAQIRSRTPEAVTLHQQYKEVTYAIRKFLADGPTAMLSQKGLKQLNQTRGNYVPLDIHAVNAQDNVVARMVDASRPLTADQREAWFLHKRDIEKVADVDNRVDSFEILVDYARAAIRHKMENDVRGLYVDKMMQSQYGSKTVRKKTKDELDKYGSRTVEFYKGGDKQKFVSSKLQADLLHFDPYIAQYPFLYAPKRLFEQGTTGALGLTFAPVTLLRDSFTGKALSESTATTGPVAALKEVPRQLGAKIARGASEILEDSFADIPFIDKAKQRQLATYLGNVYSRSMLSRANTVGGIDASLMRTNIEIRKGAWREAANELVKYSDGIPGATRTGHTLRALANGWVELFGAIQDAPRAAWFRDAVEKGVPDEVAAVQARRITGDTSRSGRVFMNSGRMMDADAVNKEALIGSNIAGMGIELVREAIPYFNPTVQGLRRLATRIIEDPIQTNLQAWKYIGLPSLAAFAWNELLGPEYNDHAHNNRSSYDQAMSIYIGMPGQDPRYGIEFPVGHEMTPWSGIFPSALYSLGRGEREVGESLVSSGTTILENAGMIGFPTVVGTMMSASGVNPPDSILQLHKGVYPYREDNIGLLPENVEKTIRSIFGGVSDFALHTAAAAYDGGPKAFVEEFGHQWARKSPIVRNVAGTQTNVSSFTPISDERWNKLEAFNEFKDLYDQHFHNADRETFNQRNLTQVKRDSQETPVPRGPMAPIPSLPPTNPVYPLFGAMIRAKLGTNEDGMSGLRARVSLMNKHRRILRGYNAGKSAEWAEFQRGFDTAQQDFEDAYQAVLDNEDMTKRERERALRGVAMNEGTRADIYRTYEALGIDLGTRKGVLELLNYVEGEAVRMAQEQLKLIDEVEDQLTIELRQQGILGPNQKFDIRRHLRPHALAQ